MRLARWAAAAALVLSVFAITSVPDAAAVQAQPNIIVVMVDDMREDDLTQGTAMADTRNIIGTGATPAQGTRYENFSASYPLCCPSRVTFLTGQYPHNTGVLDNVPPDGGWQAFHDQGTEQTETLPIWLDAAGYRTMMVGKYLNHYGDAGDGEPDTFIPNGWDSWVAFVHGVGYVTYDLNINGTIQTQGGSHYSTTDLTDRAVFQLNSNLDSDVPIFMWLSLFAPHSAGQDANGMCSVPAEAQYTGVSNAGLPTSAAFNEPNVSDKPGWIQARPQFNAAERAGIENCRNERLDSLRSVDDAVVRIRDMLVDHGELSNTVLVFVSDNGLMLGEHRICSPCNKNWTYEESAGVPLAVRGDPGITPGVKSRTVSNVDLAPSIVGWAGPLAQAEVPVGFFDGQPLSQNGGNSRVVLLEKRGNGTADPPLYAGLRTQQTWTFTDYATGLDELYDGATQEQTDNKIAVASYDDEEAELRALVEQLRDCDGFLPDAAASTTDCNAQWALP